MTKNASIPNADLKVRKTSIATLGDIHTLLAEAGAEQNEISAFSAHITGSSLLNAAVENGLQVKGEVPANTVGRTRARLNTLMIAMFKAIAAPAAEAVAAENQAQVEAENEAELAEKIAKWEQGGCIGRKPGEGNRPKYETRIEQAHKQARRDARKGLGIKEQGRIVPDMQAKFVEKFTALYAKALKGINKEFDLGYDEAKIEKMVKAGVKLLPAAAQKAAKQSPKAKGKGKDKGNKVQPESVPATDSETADQTEAVPVETE
jgi:hypothetical protein